jgi:hypothetical membrane protein
MPAQPASPNDEQTSLHTGQRQATRHLLACGAVGAPVFLVVILIQGAIRPGYDPMRDFGSALALGPYGWIQDTNFVATGLLMLAFAMGLRRALHPGRGSTSAPLLSVSTDSA